MSGHQDTMGDTLPQTHPEEIRAECEIRIGDKAVMRASARITPAGLVCTGLMVAAILLSTATVVRAARWPRVR